MKLRTFAILVLVVLLSVGCHRSMNHPAQIATLKSPSPLVTSLPITIHRTELIEKLRDGGALNSVRLVEVFKGAGSPNPNPEYRMFDIQTGGVFELLGIKNGDVLIAAHGYSIPSVGKFVEYVNVLPGEATSNIEIVRNRRPILLSFSIID